MGQHFYFCGPKCKARFMANLPRYTGQSMAAETVTVPAALPTPSRWNRGWLLLPAALVLLAVAGLWLS